MLLPLALVLSATPVVELDAGPLKATVSASEAAQVFHIVDQLSGWSPFSHAQYRAELFAADAGGLSPDEEGLLAAHAALRRRVGYGALEALFYTPSTLDSALAAAAKDGRLTPDEVQAEAAVLRHFRPRLKPFLASGRPWVDAFSRGLVAASPELKAFATRAARFLEVKGAAFPIFLVPSPGRVVGGGGFNGGVLTVEVVDGQAPLDVVLHEAWHALADGRHELLAAAAGGAEGLDYETLSEGLAYAISPGIWRFHGAKGDRLAGTVRGHLEAQQHFLDVPLVRFNRLGLALRPSLQRALDADGHLSAYLPTAVVVYEGLYEVAQAQERTPRGYFCFGKAKPLGAVIAERENDVWVRELDAKGLASVAKKIRRQDVVVLLLTPASLGSIPKELEALAGPEWPKTAVRVAHEPRGEAALQGSRGRVLVFWAAEEEGAIALAGKSAALFD